MDPLEHLLLLLLRGELIGNPLSYSGAQAVLHLMRSVQVGTN